MFARLFVQICLVLFTVVLSVDTLLKHFVSPLLKPRSKKRRPTFRRLLKTSGMKLENKLKNRQLKQQNIAKKQRKEQKKLRQAVKDANIRTPRPLETYRKRPGEALLSHYGHFMSHDALLRFVCSIRGGGGGGVPGHSAHRHGGG